MRLSDESTFDIAPKSVINSNCDDDDYDEYTVGYDSSIYALCW